MKSLSVNTYLKISVAVALLTIALKTGAWWFTDSVSLLSDAMESLVNLAGAMFALAMVTVAQQPADEDHPFGHHKAEYFSSGFEGVLILVAALAIMGAAVHRLFNPQPVEALGLGLALSIFSSALNGALAWAMLRKAKEHRSIALEADARHLFTDVWTSVGVVAALVLVSPTNIAPETLRDFVAWGKQRAGQISFASPGTGTRAKTGSAARVRAWAAASNSM